MCDKSRLPPSRAALRAGAAHSLPPTPVRVSLHSIRALHIAAAPDMGHARSCTCDMARAPSRDAKPRGVVDHAVTCREPLASLRSASIARARSRVKRVVGVVTRARRRRRARVAPRSRSIPLTSRDRDLPYYGHSRRGRGRGFRTGQRDDAQDESDELEAGAGDARAKARAVVGVVEVLWFKVLRAGLSGSVTGRGEG